jgi:hypothetical protein
VLEYYVKKKGGGNPLRLGSSDSEGNMSPADSQLALRQPAPVYGQHVGYDEDHHQHHRGARTAFLTYERHQRFSGEGMTGAFVS